MVQVGMGKEHVIDGNGLWQAQFAGTGAGVNQQVVINLVAGGAQLAGNAAVATKNMGTHGLNLVWTLMPVFRHRFPDSIPLLPIYQPCRVTHLQQKKRGDQLALATPFCCHRMIIRHGR
jgi:hypothetical protein